VVDVVIVIVAAACMEEEEEEEEWAAFVEVGCDLGGDEGGKKHQK
jgi:hypothetical protein